MATPLHSPSAKFSLLSLPSSSPVLPPTVSLTAAAKNAKRFGKKEVQTVDLLGAPLPVLGALKPLDEPRPVSLGENITAEVSEATKEGKSKRKFFAKVDRSKEPSLAPTSGRSRKAIQGLAALSLLAGAGLFAVSLLDKKSATPPAPVTVDPAAPSTSVPLATVQTPEIDPVTGLPLPTLPSGSAVDGAGVDGSVLDGAAVDGSVDGAAVAGSVLDGAAVDSSVDGSGVDGSGVDGSAVESSLPSTDPALVVPTIPPGPDDLEFSTGGDFSAG